MRRRPAIWILCLGLALQPFGSRAAGDKLIDFEFCGSRFEFRVHPSVDLPLGNDRGLNSLRDFCKKLLSSDHASLSRSLNAYRENLQMDDWLFYQLVRQVAQRISPKADDYYRYTIYKWLLMRITGYEPLLRLSPDKLLFYIRCGDNIYNIPCYIKNDQQFVCLNYHDYNNDVAFDIEVFEEVDGDPGNARNFSYQVNRLPDFPDELYEDRDIQFDYGQQRFHFTVKVNPQVQALFVNYPALDYGSVLNIPMSRRTYETLIPGLKKQLEGRSVREGVDYLMNFTRSAFVFATDEKIFGREKRMTPEQTLLYEQSDCEDRVSLFYCLVKEIYDLPMIVLSYPEHITIAVKLDRPVGRPVIYNGQPFTVCEPTPQKKDLPLGHLMPDLRSQPFEVVYAYQPGH